MVQANELSVTHHDLRRVLEDYEAVSFIRNPKKGQKEFPALGPNQAIGTKQIHNLNVMFVRKAAEANEHVQRVPSTSDGVSKMKVSRKCVLKKRDYGGGGFCRPGGSL